MKRFSNKLTLAAAIGRQPQLWEKLHLSAQEIMQIDLGSAGLVGTLTVEGFPFDWCVSDFHRSGSHWRIIVSSRLDDSCRDARIIWSAALRLATRKVGKHLMKSDEHAWVQRALIPLGRDGDVAMQFVTEEVMPVINEARKILVDFAISGPKPPEVEVK